MAEVALRENIGLLTYSPMAFGVLSGKYIKGTAGEDARLKLFPRFARYSSEQSTEATRRYLKIAEDNNITLAQMSLAFVNQQPFGGAPLSGTNDKAGSILNLLRWVSPQVIKQNLSPPHDFTYDFMK